MERMRLAGLLFLCLLSHGCLVESLRTSRQEPRRSLRIRGSDFVLEQGGAEHLLRFHAGEVHYFRVPEAYWGDRLLRVRAMGLNTVSTYVPWNFHEELEGKFDFSSDMHNLTKFIRMADSLGLLVILRPGPYICSEWDFGGLPWWLLRHTLANNTKFRSANPKFLELVDRFWGELLPQVRPLLLEEGGPVAMVQLENEFGHFGNASGADRPYFDALEATARRYLGPKVLLMTTDAAGHNADGLGTTPSLFAATNLGPWYEPHAHIRKSLAATSRHNLGGPELVMELWTGWFQTVEQSNFTEKHFRQPGQQLLGYVKALLDRNASFTLYMAHGGTNFGFFNSAGALTPTKDGQLHNVTYIVTSYDYSAPISEAGLHGFGGDGVDKYAVLRALLSQHQGTWERLLPEEPAPPVLSDYPGDGPGGAVQFSQRANVNSPEILSALCEGGAEESAYPTPFEFHERQRTGGLGLYTFEPAKSKKHAGAAALLEASDELAGGGFLEAQREGRGLLKLKARDRVHVWSGGQLVAQAVPNTVYGKKGKLGHIRLMVPTGKHHRGALKMQILVEHLGRRAFVKRRTGNLDPESYEDWKGLSEVWFGGNNLTGVWRFCSLPLHDLHESGGQVPGLSLASTAHALEDGPAFYQAAFRIDGEPRGDTFLRLDAGAWNSGFAFVNGVNLGRYARGARGPFDLYVPRSKLKSGENWLVMAEMDPPSNMTWDQAVVTFNATRSPMLPTGP